MSGHDPIAALAATPPSTPPPMSSALEAELANLTPVPGRRPLRQLAVLIAASLIYGAGLVTVLAVRRDAGELPVAWLVGASLLWLVGFLIPVHAALTPSPSTMIGRWRFAAIAAITASIGFVVLGFVIHPSGPSSLHYGTEKFLRGHGCLEIGLLTALVPVALGTIFLRRAMPVGSRAIAAALGAAGGALGGLVLHLHCHIADGLHLGAIHGGVVVVSALLATAFVPRVIEPR